MIVGLFQQSDEGDTAMAERARMTAAQLADKLLQDEHADVLRETVAWMARELMEADVSAQLGAELGERSLERITHRNGYRPRQWDTRVGSIELAIPKLRQGSYFPSFLEPRRRAEQALVAVVQEAYVNGVSTRKVDRLVAQLGLQGMGKDQVSRLCRGLDEQVRVFRERPLEGAYPYLWLDAKVERVREPGGVRHKALVIAYGVHHSGRREVIAWMSARPRPRASGGTSCAACAPGAWTGCGCASPTPMPASRPPSRRCWAAPGSAAPSPGAPADHIAVTLAARSVTAARWQKGAADAPAPRRLPRRGSRPYDGDNDDLEELGTPVYQGTSLSVRALTAEELQRFLDAHHDQPTELLGSGWATLDPSGQPLGIPWTPPAATPPAPVGPPSGSLGSPGRAALAAARRRRSEELAGWTRTLVWRAPLVAAAGITGHRLTAQAGLPWAGLVGLVAAAVLGWRLRFRPSEQARSWRRGAEGERHTARRGAARHHRLDQAPPRPPDRRKGGGKEP
jgi:Transposase, Mutator family